MIKHVLAAASLLAQAKSAQGLSAAGWIFLVVAWGLVGSITVFCFYRILTPSEKK